MKIIDIAKCVDNKDPLGIGRIRFSRFNDLTGVIENAITYEPWSDRDLFIAQPFLPSNINFIPDEGQSIKIINYDTDKKTVNIEYVSGPFTTMYDFNGQIPRKELFKPNINSNADYEIKGDFDIIYEKNKKSQT